MSTPPFPEVPLVVTAITRGSEFLTVFHPAWGGFTLPMTKRRSWSDPSVPGQDREEEPRSAAIRAAAKALGRPIGPDEIVEPIELPDLQPYQQSDRDGAWRIYRATVFRMEVPEGEVPTPSGGHAAAWMTVEAIQSHQPVTPTATRIVDAIRGAAVLRGDR